MFLRSQLLLQKKVFMTNKLITTEFFLKPLHDSSVDTLLLQKGKFLLGKSPQCDLVIDDVLLSSIHACLLVEDGQIQIRDLFSQSGVYINGIKVTEGVIFPGDQLKIGALDFKFESLPQNSINPSLLPIEGFHQDNFSDIVFNDSDFVPLKTFSQKIDLQDFVELDQIDQPCEIISKTKTTKIEVINYLSGLINDINYVTLDDGDYFISPNKESNHDLLFFSTSRKKIFTYSNNTFHFHPDNDFSFSSPINDLDFKNGFFITKGTEQLFLRIINQSFTRKTLPLFFRQKEFLKQSSRTFATLFLPLILLLFVSLPSNQDPIEEVAVVYQLPKVQEKITSIQENQNQSSESESTKSTSVVKAEQKNNTMNESPASSKKVLAKTESTQPTKASIKSYEFNSNALLDSVTGDAPEIGSTGQRKGSSHSDSHFDSSQADKGGGALSTDFAQVSKMGASGKGSGNGQFGSRGLASKSGFDTATMGSKTVVLGSIDPELLRKILREYIPQFRHCYQKELTQHSEKIKGILDLNFTISSTGKVSKYDIEIKDAKFSKSGVGCMGQVLSLIEFPKPKGGGLVDVKQPLNFMAETEQI